MPDNITYSGLHDLKPEEQLILKSIIERDFPKLKRYIKKDIELLVHVRVLKKESRSRYDVSLRIEAPARIISEKNVDSERGGDWDLKKSCHRAVKALENELEHKFRNTNTRKFWKMGGIKRSFG